MQKKIVALRKYARWKEIAVLDTWSMAYYLCSC